MQRFGVGCLYAGSLLLVVAMFAAADDAKDKDEAIKKDRKLYEGTWRMVALVVNGEKTAEEDVRKFTVVNGADGSWSLRSEGNEIHRGRNVLDPSKKPKTIDVIVIDGGKDTLTILGIYEITEKTRRLCYVSPGLERPTEFTSTAGSERVLVTFEREKAK